MGEVYKARDTRLDRTVAIKVLPGALATEPELRERFDREARAISQLAHANICTLFDVGDHEGTAFLVMELLDGESLEQRRTRDTRVRRCRCRAGAQRSPSRSPPRSTPRTAPASSIAISSRATSC